MNKIIYKQSSAGVLNGCQAIVCLVAVVIVQTVSAQDSARDSGIVLLPPIPGSSLQSPQPPMPTHEHVPVVRQSVDEAQIVDPFEQDSPPPAIQSYEPLGKGSRAPFGGYAQPASPAPVDMVFGIQKLDQIVIGHWQWRNPHHSQDFASLHFLPDHRLTIENNDLPDQSGQWSVQDSAVIITIEDELVVQGNYTQGKLHFDFPMESGHKLFVFNKVPQDSLNPFTSPPQQGNHPPIYVPAPPQSDYVPGPDPYPSAPVRPAPDLPQFPKPAPQAGLFGSDEFGIAIYPEIAADDYKKAESLAVALANEIGRLQNRFPQLRNFSMNRHFIRNSVNNNLLPGSPGNPELFSINYHNGVLAMRKPQNPGKVASVPEFDPNDGIILNVHIFNGPSRGQAAESRFNPQNKFHTFPFPVSINVRGNDSEAVEKNIREIVERLISESDS